MLAACKRSRRTGCSGNSLKLQPNQMGGTASAHRSVQLYLPFLAEISSSAPSGFHEAQWVGYVTCALPCCVRQCPTTIAYKGAKLEISTKFGNYPCSDRPSSTKASPLSIHSAKHRAPSPLPRFTAPATAPRRPSLDSQRQPPRPVAPSCTVFQRQPPSRCNHRTPQKTPRAVLKTIEYPC